MARSVREMDGLAAFQAFLAETGDGGAGFDDAPQTGIVAGGHFHPVDEVAFRSGNANGVVEGRVVLYFEDHLGELSRNVAVFAHPRGSGADHQVAATA